MLSVVVVTLAPRVLLTEEPAKRPYLALNEILTERYQFHIAPAYRPIHIKEGTWSLKAAPVGADDVDGYVPILFEELLLYPVEFDKAIKLRRIVLCTRLMNGEVELCGCALASDHTIYLNESPSGCTAAHLRGSLHHELFHMADQADSRLFGDDEWSGLNPPGFEYRRFWLTLADSDLDTSRRQ